MKKLVFIALFFLLVAGSVFGQWADIPSWLTNGMSFDAIKRALPPRTNLLRGGDALYFYYNDRDHIYYSYKVEPGKGLIYHSLSGDGFNMQKVITELTAKYGQPVLGEGVDSWVEENLQGSKIHDENGVVLISVDKSSRIVYFYFARYLLD